VARTTPVKKALRSLTWLLVIVAALTALNGYAVLFQHGSWAPKLALDLEAFLTGVVLATGDSAFYACAPATPLAGHT
jgi:preprotein translocase subunit SecD